MCRHTYYDIVTDIKQDGIYFLTFHRWIKKDSLWTVSTGYRA